MLAARADPRPEEEEEGFGARTARQTVQCSCVGRCAANALFTRPQASITPSSRISKRSARAMASTCRARTEAGSEPAALFQNAVLSMAQSFQLDHAQRARRAVELECVQLSGCRGSSIHTRIKIRAAAPQNKR